MYKKILGKSLGGTALAGLVLTAAPIVAAPQIAQVACSYTSPIATQTAVTLSAYIAPYGNATTATVKVSSSTASQGTPSGTVTVTVGGTSTTSSLNSAGEAAFGVPRTLGAKTTYSVTAVYNGGGCATTGTFSGSSDSKNYTVVRGKAVLKAKVVKGRLGKFKATVKTPFGTTVKTGKVVFTVKKNGKVVSRKLAKVKKGVARVDGKNLGKGRYRLTAKYLGNKNMKATKKIKKFRV